MRDHSEIWEEIEARYACDHPHKLLCNKPNKSGHPLVAEQCVTCGKRAGNVHPSKNFSRTEIEALPLWNRDIETAYSKRKWAELSSVTKTEKDKEDKAWWDRYEAHLQSPKWKGLRKKVIERAEGICEGCGHNRPTQAHHLTYERVCDEMLFDLVAVCESCHSKVHRKKPTFVDEAEEDYQEGAPLY